MNDGDHNKEPLLSKAEQPSTSESSELVDCTSSENAKSPPKIFFMRGLSSEFTRKERCKQIIFSIFNIANAAMGAGILSFPYAFSLGGYGLGVLLTLFAAASNAYTLSVILYCARKYEVSSYQALVEKMFGKRAKTWLLLAIMLFLFFCNTSYMMVICSSTSTFMESLDGLPPLATNKYLLTSAVWLLVLPLSFIKDLSFLGPFSIIGVLAIAYVVLTLLVHNFMKEEKVDASEFKPFIFRPCAFQVVPITMFGMFCHLTTVPACSELQAYWPSLHSAGKTRYRTLVIVAISVTALCSFMYVPTGIIGFRLFGAAVQSDVLDSFGRNATSGLASAGSSGGLDIKIARLCMTLTTALGYPVSTFLARLTFWDVIGEKKYLSLPYILVTICFAGATLLLALVLIALNQHLDIIMSVTSATAGVTIQFLFPSFMLLKTGFKMKGYLGIFLSVLMAVLSMFVTVANGLCKAEFPTGRATLTTGNTVADFCRVMGLLETAEAANNVTNTLLL